MSGEIERVSAVANGAAIMSVYGVEWTFDPASAFRSDLLALLSTAASEREALPAMIGRLQLGDKSSDGERLCSHSHAVPASHPLYWPVQISQFDDSDPCCLAHAIEQAESEQDWGTAASERRVMEEEATFLNDLASRLFKSATPAMGFDQGDVDQLYRIAGALAAKEPGTLKSGDL
jgi:hypothetical protein